MRATIPSLTKKYGAGEKFAVVTAYDYTSARIVEHADIPVILVGDSLGMVVQGQPSTLSVTVDDMIYHTRMVVRGAATPLIVTDLPFGSYAFGEDAVRAATRIMGEGGCQSVKLEGGERIAPIVRHLVDLGIPVMGHLGYTPQSVHSIGTRVQARDAAAAKRIIRDALALQRAGAWAIVLELVPAPLATAITELLDIPTVGIGAGAGCSAQVQVWHDLLGLYDEHVPRHARAFRSFAAEGTAALDEYAAAVRDGSFPADENASTMDADELARALSALR